MYGQNAHLETEAKLRVDSLAVVESKLAVMGAILRQERVFERNVRYDDAAHTLDSQGVVLRLRQDARARLTYKGPRLQAEGDIQTRLEIEVTVNDFEAMDLILRKLGYDPTITYEKYRTTYSLLGTEVALDELPFGTFVEVEGERNAIESVIAGLTLQNVPRYTESYAQLFDIVRTNIGLAFDDLTFDNFAGLTVPPEAFAPQRG
jgi:adenylate cyclase class 2